MFLFLRIKDGYLSEYILNPNMHRTQKSVVIFSREIMIDKRIVATCHSHPSGSFYPSDEDLRTFRNKPINLIIGYPYNILNIGIYDGKGIPLKYDIINQF